MAESLLKQLEKSGWFMAIMIILGNLGMRYIDEDLTKKQCNYLNCQVMRKVVLAALIFCGTKNIFISIIATLVYMIVIKII